MIFVYKLYKKSNRKINTGGAISRLDAGSFDLLLAKQNMQGGIRDVTERERENEGVREGQRYNTSHHFENSIN